MNNGKPITLTTEEPAALPPTLRLHTEDIVLVVSKAGLCLAAYATDDTYLSEPAERLRFRHVREIFPPEVSKKFLKAIERQATLDPCAQFAFAVASKRKKRQYQARVIKLDRHLMFALRDVTSRIRTASLEEELERLRRERAHDARIKLAGRMTANLVHELQQPLGAILINTDCATNSATSNASTSLNLLEILADISADARRASALVEHLRNFLAKRDRLRELLPVDHLIQDTVDLLRHELRRYAVDIAIELGPNLPRLNANRVQLQQVLANLLINSTDSVRRNPFGQRHICLRARLVESRVVVTVTDSGRGFTAKELSEAFQPFSSRKRNGMGLGLSICRDIVETHGGQITAGNGELGGAFVQVSLPTAQRQNDARTVGVFTEEGE